MAEADPRSGPALPLAVTPGEPAGVGTEITLMARSRMRGGQPFFLIADLHAVGDAARRLGSVVEIVEIAAAGEAAAAFAHGLPVLPLSYPVAVTPGRPDPANGGAVIAAIERAAALSQAGEAAAVVTNPIQKSALYQAGFRHPGHTEFLAALSGPGVTPVMLLATADLRVVPVTIHVALRQVFDLLTADLIVTTGRITADALRHDFAIDQPRLAVSGLNPHAGEAGTMGREEDEVIRPAIERLKAEGIDAFGPEPGDTMFHAEARARYDAALCMYHDQALIPLKTLDFWGGVNVTLGLPFVRTSPDHGTALDLAGTGRAYPASLIAALSLAGDLAARRAAHRADRAARAR